MLSIDHILCHIFSSSDSKE